MRKKQRRKAERRGWLEWSFTKMWNRRRRKVIERRDKEADLKLLGLG
jgi:hypothetical protein